MQLDHERPGLAVDLGRCGQQGEQGGFVGLFKRGSAIALKLAYLLIDERANRLDQIVGQTKRVAAVAVMQTDRRVQPCGADSAGHGGAERRVTVIEQIIGRRTVSFAAKRSVRKKCLPINLSGLGLDVGWVPGAHFARQGHELFVLQVVEP